MRESFIYKRNSEHAGITVHRAGNILSPAEFRIRPTPHPSFQGIYLTASIVALHIMILMRIASIVGNVSNSLGKPRAES